MEFFFLNPSSIFWIARSLVSGFRLGIFITAEYDVHGSISTETAALPPVFLPETKVSCTRRSSSSASEERLKELIESGVASIVESVTITDS